MKKEDYLAKWINGTLTDDEKALFKATDDYESLEKFSRASLSKSAPEYDVQGQLDQLLDQRPAKTLTINWVSSILKIAAVLLVVFGASYFFLIDRSPIQRETISLAKEPFFLPDSSQVILNTFSEVNYVKANWNSERLVELKGEGFFKVRKGSKFEVATEAGSIRVLGTEFNVKMRANYFEVVCYEGSVEVVSGQKSYTLKPLEVFRKTNGSITQGQVPSVTSPSWIKGESAFSSIPLIQVIEEFERQYNVSIDREGLDLDQKYTGRFTHNDIDLALQAITTPLKLEYQIVDNRVTLNK